MATMKGGFQDDEIVFLSESSSGPMRCQICNKNLQRDSPDQRQAHYEHHLDGDSYPTRPTASTSTLSSISSKFSSKSPKSKGKSRQLWKPITLASKSDQNEFWYTSLESPPPFAFQPGLIPLLRKALIKSHDKGTTTRAVLCYENTVLVNSEFWDKGWGCGYRNFLMSCTALMSQQLQPDYFPLLDSPSPPGIRNLQKWIEQAWGQGYDEEGAEQLKRQLFGTSKWIGTAELHIAFTSRSIPSTLVDFNLSSHPSKGAQPVIDWVVRYFSSPSSSSPTQVSNPIFHSLPKEERTVQDALRGASPVEVHNDKMPVVLQHKGHSRTVVGFEVVKGKPGVGGKWGGGVNLLIFDPSKKPGKDVRLAGLEMWKASRSRSFEGGMGDRSSSASTSTSKPKSSGQSRASNSNSNSSSKPRSSDRSSRPSSKDTTTSQSSQFKSSHSHSPMRIINEILHPRQTILNKISSGDKKRKSADVDDEVEFVESGGGGGTKRVKGRGEPDKEVWSRRQEGMGVGSKEMEVLVIDDSDDEVTSGDASESRMRVRGGGREDWGRKENGDVDVDIEWEEEEGVQGSGKAGKDVDLIKMLGLFRVSAKDLKKHDKYQILYFPMSDPLSDREKMKGKVVMSEKGC
ncbi:hypothetical protein JAAARDRAFT_31585 [Jaapia argillacea MUCL 33604]|uniref:UFSP1/2/DUB catalytic domain-containing protein n=1 Tax=Jaapia argillacea MUCL 33604 TaxID=933084 RepID=A0A067Q0L6_9AGAM|nr:hypothetical protein JAAARDRAFT_31585 [Jaapia argillacea MUCL 33604]